MNVSAPFILRPIATSLLGVAVLLGGITVGSRRLEASAPELLARLRSF